MGDKTKGNGKDMAIRAPIMSWVKNRTSTDLDFKTKRLKVETDAFLIRKLGGGVSVLISNDVCLPGPKPASSSFS